MKTDYSKQMTAKTFVTLSETMNDVQDKIHAQLYERALSRMISERGLNTDSYRFIELPASYYDAPSYVAVTPSRKPRKTINISLAPWWDENYFSPENVNPLTYTFVSDETETSTLELDGIDYVKGIAKIRSRYTGHKAFVNIKDVPSTMQRSEDFGSINRTFTELIRNDKKGIVTNA